MKKYLIFSLLSLIFTFSVFAEKTNDVHPTKRIEANPINIAIMLMQEKDTASMASTLKYYGYGMQASQPADGYAVYTHSNGSIIRLSFPNIADNGQRTTDNLHTIVEVTSKGSTKEKEHILQNLNFTKDGPVYEQKSVGSRIKCTIGPHGTLILTRISKKRE